MPYRTLDSASNPRPSARRFSFARVGAARVAFGLVAIFLMIGLGTDFYVSPNVDLEIDVGSMTRPKTTEDFDRSRYEQIALMPVTTGSINYEIPRSVTRDEWSSIVIWCEPLHIAYAAATLEPVR